MKEADPDKSSKQMEFNNLPSQGARAGQSGTSLELMLEAMFKARKIKSVNDNPEFHYEPQLFPRDDKVLIRQVLINGWKVDFLFKNFRTGLKLPIECKQQLGNGTTDEKLAHTVDKLVGCKCKGFWLVLSGGGFSPKMVNAIHNKINAANAKERTHGRLIVNEGPFLQRSIQRLLDHGEL